MVLYFLALRLFLCGSRLAGHEPLLYSDWLPVSPRLLFSVHPLRVESVAWATERRDVLSGLFFLLYYSRLLTAVTNGKADAPLAMDSVFAGRLSFRLLAKAITMTLPVVLLCWICIPLRRLGTENGWWSPKHARCWREKLPFRWSSLVAAAVALLPSTQLRGVQAVGKTWASGLRLRLRLYGLSFYFWKTLLPFKLSPLYEIRRVRRSYGRWSVLAERLCCHRRSRVVGVQSAARCPAVFAELACLRGALGTGIGNRSERPPACRRSVQLFACMSWAVLAGGGLVTFLADIGRLVDFTDRYSCDRLCASALLFGLGAPDLAADRRSGTIQRGFGDMPLQSGKSRAFAHNNLGMALAEQNGLTKRLESFARSFGSIP